MKDRLIIIAGTVVLLGVAACGSSSSTVNTTHAYNLGVAAGKKAATDGLFNTSSPGGLCSAIASATNPPLTGTANRAAFIAGCATGIAASAG